MNYNDYGALVKYMPELEQLIDFSEKAVEIYVKAIEQNPQFALSEHTGIFNLLFYQSKSTSYSIRLLNTWGQPVEALALLRIRLEQSIISSYLLYEQFEEGLGAYIKFYSELERAAADRLREELKANSILMDKAPELYKIFEDKLNEYDTNKKDYENKEGNNKRSWYKGNIYQLAVKRDNLAPKDNLIGHISFEKLHQAIYQSANSMVHGDIAAISNNYVDLSKDGTLMPQIFNIYNTQMQCTHLDIIQTYELLNYYCIDRNAELEELYKQFSKFVAVQFGIDVENISNSSL